MRKIAHMNFRLLAALALAACGAFEGRAATRSPGFYQAFYSGGYTKTSINTRCDGEEATASSFWSGSHGRVAVTTPAAPKAGFAFSHWEGTPINNLNKTLAALSLVLTEPTTLTAVYVPAKYVATPGDGGSDATGDGSAERPYESAQKAVDALGADGGVVEVAAGTYALTNQVTIATPVILRGASRETTFFDVSATSGVRCVMISNMNARVCGLTLAGSSKVKGGGVAMWSGRVEDCAFTGHNYSYGAALVTLPTATTSASRWAIPIVSRCVFTNNTSSITTYCRNGVVCEGNGAHGLYMDNCLIANNNGIAFYNDFNNYNDPNTFSNCTFVVDSGNVLSGNSKIQLFNCIAYGKLNFENKTHFAATHTCFADVATNGYTIKTGCILVDDPLFADAAGGDYRLRSDSPCVNAGLPVMHQYDVLQAARTSGTAPDMGCYEYDLSSASCTLVWDREIVFAGDTPNFTVKVFDDGAEHDYAYTVTLTEKRGGTIVQKTPTFAHTFDEAGLYDIRVDVVDRDDPTYGASYERAAGLYAAATTNYVTKIMDAAGEWPYDTPAKATSDVRKAFDVTVKGSTVAFTEGSHPITEPIFLDLPIVLAGAGGKERTTLDATGTSGVRCVILSNTLAKVSGLTFQGARNVKGGGVLMCGGRVEDCAFTDCGDASGAAIATAKTHVKDWTMPVVSRCYVTNNPCGKDNAAVLAEDGAGKMTLDNCLIAYNTGIGFKNAFNNQNLWITNCTVIGNSQYQLWADNEILVYNSIVVGNLNQSWGAKMIPAYHSCFLASVTNKFTIGTGCIVCATVDDIRFKNAEQSDYRLGRRSPCVGAGLYNATLDALLDLDGRPRVWQATEDDPVVVDMGCYQSRYTHNGLIFIIQ